MPESFLRSLVKAISWRFTGTIATFFVSWIITGTPKIALTIASVEFASKIMLYWIHERVWLKIKWGKNGSN